MGVMDFNEEFDRITTVFMTAVEAAVIEAFWSVNSACGDDSSAPADVVEHGIAVAMIGVKKAFVEGVDAVNTRLASDIVSDDAAVTDMRSRIYGSLITFIQNGTVTGLIVNAHVLNGGPPDPQDALFNMALTRIFTEAADLTRVMAFEAAGKDEEGEKAEERTPVPDVFLREFPDADEHENGGV